MVIVSMTLHFKGVRVDGFTEYSSTKWLALSLRGYGSWGECARYEPYYNRWEDYQQPFPLGGTVGIKLVPLTVEHIEFSYQGQFSMTDPLKVDAYLCI